MRATSSNDEEWSTVWKCYHILYVYFCVMIEMITSVKAGRVVTLTCPFYNALKMVRSPLHPYEDFRKTPDLS